ncbi:helicase-related protein [Neobacillus sp. YIM B06451]|uniref:helicase-related protein n=1 Tax=Neobacillus sp. YIM B06451 TaxID=3070994 RepID=UPI00292D2399|nr:helicase-related protein [Neobacillus sp. YIM B06451]
MGKLESITPGTLVKGIIDDTVVTILDVKWFGKDIVEVSYKDSNGNTGTELLFRNRESEITIVNNDQIWSLSGDGTLFRLISEAYRIRLAYLFDPMLAVHTSLVEPLPHQITAVYEKMLPRQPLRFLLADDPGAGKTIMAGLLIRELFIRGDLTKCMVVCPGILAEQWQEELISKFHLPFRLISRNTLNESFSGNPFKEYPFLISRLDYLARNEDVIELAKQVDWDLIIFDEAHKMSASFFGGEMKATKRYRLGQQLGNVTRNLLLMTATPHNGKEEDFQLFMALIDSERFEGKFRNGVHQADTSDIMRRLVKEQLLKFDNTPLFPERIAYTVTYLLSELEEELYVKVTSYVRAEWNRANELNENGRKGTVGFALTILQRRLASSPEAIYQSLLRRQKRLEKRLNEERKVNNFYLSRPLIADFSFTEEQLDEWDEFPSEESELAEQEIVDQATASRTVSELEGEISTLKTLVSLANKVRHSGVDKKWEELSSILRGESYTNEGVGLYGKSLEHKKLVIFTEHRDTLNYLRGKITKLLGRQDAVVTIHGAMSREEKKKAQLSFTQEKEVQVLIATDAAGEGINLQNAHLMVNYDLPWNPNRLEQRFGRIHRIGQTEVCHLWNLVAEKTREGDVFTRLLSKLQVEREALGGSVFDVLGKVFSGKKLKELLMEAILYGEDSEVRSRMEKTVDTALDHEHLKKLIEDRALATDTMDWSKIQSIREEMERAEARRLQPHFVMSFFKETLDLFGGIMREREPGRFEILRVPNNIVQRKSRTGLNNQILSKYERICFDKTKIRHVVKPMAEFICPGHPLLEAIVDLILERYQYLLRDGAILVDEQDDSDCLRMLVYLQNQIVNQQKDDKGNRQVVSQEMHFVEISEDGITRDAGYAPYLDYRPLKNEEIEKINVQDFKSFVTPSLREKALTFAVESIVPTHLATIKERKEEWVKKTISAVRERLIKEINYWDQRSLELREAEKSGKVNAKLNADNALRRADELQNRLEKRLKELEQEKRLSALPPNVIGGALILPIGFINKMLGVKLSFGDSVSAENRQKIERIAMEAVIKKEIELGNDPIDVSSKKVGYDIESRIPNTGKIRFIEVKGRHSEATTITVTQNEVKTCLNKPDAYFLAIVHVEENKAREPLYVKNPFKREVDFGVTSVNYDIKALLKLGERTY